MNSFLVGTILNKPTFSVKKNLQPIYKKVRIRYPSRLNAMAIDPSKVAPNKNNKYSPGEVIFAVSLYRWVQIQLRDDGQIKIVGKTPRKALIIHAALLMKSLLRTSYGFTISVSSTLELKHCGLGSSSGTISAVAVSINEMFGNPIHRLDLLQFLAQNHGEEIDDMPNSLEAVQCIGGSAAAGLIPGAITVLTGDSRPIATAKIHKKYSVIIGIPNDFIPKDAAYLMRLEQKNMYKFVRTGKAFGGRIAYRILHEMLPAMIEEDMAKIGNVIYDYRFNMGSIKNCSFVYKGLLKKAKVLSILKKDSTAEVLALSSVGPGFFAITTKPQKVASKFKNNGLVVYITTLHNDGYSVISKKMYASK